jgi:hypothetical protein
VCITEEEGRGGEYIELTYSYQPVKDISTQVAILSMASASDKCRDVGNMVWNLYFFSSGNAFWNIYLFSFAAFLEMDTDVLQLNLQQCNNYQRDVFSTACYCRLII